MNFGRENFFNHQANAFKVCHCQSGKGKSEITWQAGIGPEAIVKSTMCLTVQLELGDCFVSSH